MFTSAQFTRNAILALGALALLWLSCLEGNAQSKAFSVAPVLRSGDPISNGSFFNFCKFCDGFIDGNHGLNDSGQAVVSGAFGSFTSDGVCDSIAIGAAHKGKFIADLCQTTQFGRFSGFAGANINNNGQVALSLGQASDNGKLILLLYDNGQLTKIAAEGDPTPAGTVFGGDCGFGPPDINNNGDVAFYGCSDPDAQGISNAVYAYSGGTLRTVLKSGAPSPLGGTISLPFANGELVSVNNTGDVLFSAGQLGPDLLSPERFGLFIAKHDGTVVKIELGGDLMPNGSAAAANSVGLGPLNNDGEVAFTILLSGKPALGLFLYSPGENLKTIMVTGQPTPIGGTFSGFTDADNRGPGLGDNGSVAFDATVKGGSSTEAIFLASPNAMVEVAAVGDALPTGETIQAISSFSLNNQGQVAFFASKKQDGSAPIGLYIATPVAPAITNVKLKGAGNKLVINGNAFITNDSTILIDGQPVETEYPSAFQQSGGTTARLISRDPKLGQLLQPGQTVQVTVANSLTARTSEAFAFTH